MRLHSRINPYLLFLAFILNGPIAFGSNPDPFQPIRDFEKDLGERNSELQDWCFGQNNTVEEFAHRHPSVKPFCQMLLTLWIQITYNPNFDSTEYVNHIKEWCDPDKSGCDWEPPPSNVEVSPGEPESDPPTTEPPPKTTAPPQPNGEEWRDYYPSSPPPLPGDEEEAVGKTITQASIDCVLKFFHVSARVANSCNKIRHAPTAQNFFQCTRNIAGAAGKSIGSVYYRWLACGVSLPAHIVGQAYLWGIDTSNPAEIPQGVQECPGISEAARDYVCNEFDKDDYDCPRICERNYDTGIGGNRICVDMCTTYCSYVKVHDNEDCGTPTIQGVRYTP